MAYFNKGDQTFSSEQLRMLSSARVFYFGRTSKEIELDPAVPLAPVPSRSIFCGAQ